MISSKRTLKEIKCGETGTGILIENDGYISLDIGRNKAICESVRTGEDGWNVPYPFILDTVFQKCDIENANKRIYPKAVLMREVDKYQQRIAEHRATGEADHPSETTISIRGICLNVTELHWEKQTLVGKVEILTSEGFRRHCVISCWGVYVANLILSGIKIGVSSRGVGSVESRYGKTIVGDDFELICFDAVTEPSTPNAWMMTEPEKEKQAYVEGRETNKSALSERLSRMEMLLN